MRARTFVTTRQIGLSEATEKKGIKDTMKQVDTLLEQNGPLDEHEQDKLIQGFEELQLRQSRGWKQFFGIISLLLGAFFLHAAWSQWSAPWELRYVGEFRSVVQHGPAIAALMLQATSLILCGLGMLLHMPAKGDLERSCMPAPLRQKLILWISILISGFGAAFWIFNMLQMQARYGKAGEKWELLWVPLAPLGFCIICQTVTSSLEMTANEVSKLKGLRYEHKGA